MRKILCLFTVLTAFAAFNCTNSTGPSSTVVTVPPDVIDISHDGTSGFTFGLHGADQLKRFQTFIIDTPYLNITGIDVKIRKNDSLAACQNITVELYETAGNLPTNLLAVSSIDVDSLGGSFTVKHAPLKYSGLIAGQTYAVVIGQSNVLANTNVGFEWCTKSVDTNLCFGKYNGTSWIEESGLGDGWLKVRLSKTGSANEYSFPAGTRVVFFDDFQRTTGLIENGWFDFNTNDRNVNLYNIYDEGGGAKVARLNANMALINGDTNWTDYTVSAKFKVTTLNTVILLRFRQKDQNTFYTARLMNGTELDLWKYESGFNYLVDSTTSYSTNTYYNLKVIVQGNRFRIYFNDSQTADIDYTDPSPIPYGRIAMQAGVSLTTPQQAQPGIVDDVLVTIP